MGDLPFTRKQLVMISGGFGIVIVLMGIWAYFATHQYLTITYDASIYKSVVLYQGTESSSEKTIAPTKTVTGSTGRRNIERRCLLIVEWA